jgi:superfamily II DNA or RNA helicase
MQLKRDDLKPFQLRAGGDLSQMLAAYPGPLFKQWFNPENGQPYPFLCRLSAITGSGKTPMLALLANTLGDAIILWTTNRGAVISQTAVNLSAGGKYSELLPEDVQILELSDLSSLDWSDIVSAKTGLTIVLSTVALFNRDGDVLNVHKDRGGTTYWEMLSGRGPESRNRPLYIVYDEAHGGTKAQFSRLTELYPKAFILATASDLPEDLAHLLPGMTGEDKSESLQRQTVVVPTPDVVAAGLLKTRLYLVDCNTTRRDALKEANDKWFDLSQKLKAISEWPVMCCIVNSTLAGLEVWETLTQDLKVDPRRVAVHLASVDKALADANPNAPWGQLIDTHKAKKTPEALRNEGYTHLIWNLSLREGWDEPWAYVAYLDGSGKSVTDISQKIGRFLRQPNATPFDDGDLNSAYFYFNVPDEEFTALLTATQNELASQGYEIISISSSTTRLKTSRESPVKRAKTIAKVSESFGEDLNALDQILLDNVPLFASESLHAPGKVSTRVIDLRRNVEDGSLQKEEQRTDNADIRVWDYLVASLGAQDSRIAKKNGTCFTPFVKSDPKLKQKMQFGSPAMETLSRNITEILKRLNDELRLEYEPDQKYEVKPFNLVSPDLQTDDPKKRERYRVRNYNNALHTEYNGMNPFEVKFAEALDTLGMDWCRNPSNTGYGIPIAEIGEGTTNFYPDFLLWTTKCLWALDPKGKHLVNDAIYNKLMDISDVDDLPLKIRVALVLEGEYVLGVNNRPQKRSGNGCTLILKRSVGVRAKNYASPKALVNDLKSG